MGYSRRNFTTRGGKHRGVVENVVKDMFDGSILYLVSTCKTVIPVREEAVEEYKSKRKNKNATDK